MFCDSHTRIRVIVKGIASLSVYLAISGTFLFLLMIYMFRLFFRRANDFPKVISEQKWRVAWRSLCNLLLLRNLARISFSIWTMKRNAVMPWIPTAGRFNKALGTSFGKKTMERRRRRERERRRGRGRKRRKRVVFQWAIATSSSKLPSLR